MKILLRGGENGYENRREPHKKLPGVAQALRTFKGKLSFFYSEMKR
jgi:hypothetical protein